MWRRHDLRTIATLGSLIAFLPLVLPANQVQQPLRPAQRTVRAVGWEIPVHRYFPKAQWSTKPVKIGGVAVLMSTLQELPIPKDRPPATSPVVFTFIAGDTVVIKEERSSARQITRYSSAQGKPFLYTMYAYPCSQTRVGKAVIGGCVGADVFVAYYDLDGDGIFETMETPNPLIGTGHDWKPSKPDWVR